VSTKTFTATWDKKPFECWRVGGQVRYRREGVVDIAFKSMSEAEFRRYFKPANGESWDAQPEPTDVQGGLFS
jgi:hypothetical protein